MVGHSVHHKCMSIGPCVVLNITCPLVWGSAMYTLLILSYTSFDGSVVAALGHDLIFCIGLRNLVSIDCNVLICTIQVLYLRKITPSERNIRISSFHGTAHFLSLVQSAKCVRQHVFRFRFIYAVRSRNLILLHSIDIVSVLSNHEG
jgi:hypothetical protein